MRRIAIAAGIAALLCLGLFGGAYQSQVAVLAAIYIVLASSLNLLLGYSGLLSLGHQAFFGLGAYVSAILTTAAEVPMPVALVLAALAGLGAGWLIGVVTLRLRTAFFVIATLSVAEIGRQVALNWSELTGGPMGLAGVPPVGVGSVELVEPVAVYPVVLAVALLSVLLVSRLVRSDLGYALRAMAENENLARAVGVDTARTANLAFSIGSSMAAVAGSLYAHSVGFVSPEVFSFSIMTTTLLMVIGGGIGTVVGPVVGAVLFTQLPESLRFSEEWSLVVYGLLLCLLVRFLPHGIWGSAVRFARARSRRTASTPSDELVEVGT
jgi:branched-chain amino acid transport system permease protein